MRPLLSPANSWTRTGKIIAILLAIVASSAIAVIAEARRHWSFVVSDATWYRQLAQGLHTVPQPFASRQLGAAVVRWTSALLHWPVERAFLLQGAICLIILLAAVYALFVRSSAPRWLLLALVVVPFWQELFHGLILPDLWYAFLLSGFLWLLLCEQYLAAAIMMLPLMVSRESTSLTLVCFLFAAWKPLRWSGRLLAIAAALAGSIAVQHLTAGTSGNVEHLPQSVYLVLKVPWNFLTNVLGILPWSNVSDFFCRPHPRWQYPFHVGPVTAIGVCGYQPERPFICMTDGLTLFGLLPVLTAFLLWRGRRATRPLDTPRRTVLLRFCLLYGGVSYLIAPLLGVSAARLFGYGWPLTLIALPLLYHEVRQAPKRPAAAIAFLFLHICTCALTAYGGELAIAPYAIILNMLGFWLLVWWWGPGPQNAKSGLALPLEKPLRASS